MEQPQRNPIHLTIIVLFVLGTLAFAARALLQTGETVPEDDTFWQFRWILQIKASDQGASLRLFPPLSTNQARIIAQELFHPGLRIQRSYANPKPTREVIVKSGKAGKYKFEAVYTIHLRPDEGELINVKATPLDKESRALYLQPTEFIQTNDPLTKSTIAQFSASGKSKKELQKLVFDYVVKHVQLDQKSQIDEAVSALKQKRATDLGRARAMVALYRAVDLPARLVTGFVMAEAPQAHPHHWVELHNGSHWVPYDAKFRYEEVAPPTHVPFRRNSDKLMIVEVPVEYEESYQVSRQSVPPGVLARDLHFMDLFHLQRLPAGLRDTLYILLLLPFGTVITVAFRAFVGVRSYGTFTPTLVALAFVRADWLTATVILIVVAIIGFAGRAYLPQLKLSRTPRLSIVFTIVTLAVTLSISILDFFDFQPPGHIVLLPIVVLTTLIDRIYAVMDENGLHVAIVRLFWTAVIALACTVLFKIDFLADIIVSNPEVHFFTVALILLAGLYQGKTLIQIIPLNILKENSPSNTPEIKTSPIKKRPSISN